MPDHRLVTRFGCWAWLTATALAASGCSKADPPWSHQPDGSVVDESEPFLPGDRSGPWLGDASIGNKKPSDGGTDGSTHSATVSRVGGLWVSCYGRFRPSGDPRKDVTRLGLMCGPVNGMTQQGDTLEGEVKAGAGPPGQPGSPTVTGQFEAQAGGCYRIFAVAAPPITDLDVTVRSSRGSHLTSDQTEDSWPIVDPERPFCSFDDDTFRVEVSAKGGAGRFALQVWTLAATGSGDRKPQTK
ncbi:MAG: hypothetical protein DRI90_21505 [Deltaproteobacteria bacterium]|nr:MAG: hypothetical protein DRI90_21505 [Deltaproteobacteria bacterium]